MTDRRFRFGIVAGGPQSAEALSETARRLEGLGYGVLLFPDTQHTLSPPIAAAVAAAGTTGLHVGPHVLSAPNRTPGQVATETATLHTLTGGRYELGLGAGRPGAEQDAAALGMPFGSAGARITQVEDTIAAVRQTSPDVRIMVAAGGPKMLAAAARLADIVTCGISPRADRSVLDRTVGVLREAAGQRFDRIEIAQNLLAVGDDVPSWVLQYTGTDLAGLRAAGSVAVLSGSTGQMADVLRRRRDELGVSYVSTSLAFADVLAPVVEQLAGH